MDDVKEINMEHNIFNNADYVDFDQYKEILISEREEQEFDNPEDVRDIDVYNFISECEEDDFECEKMNLNKLLSNRVIAVADLGFWNGRKQGYKILSNNLNSIFNIGEDINKWYDDGKDVRGIFSHHDGTHYVLFRELREWRTQTNFLERILSGEKIPIKTLNYFTSSLHPYMKEIYGW